MRAIIIERSQECMQVVGVYHMSSKPVRGVAEMQYKEGKLEDYDVIEFSTLLELNNFLLSNIKI